ncbi:hypothetical protein DVK02_14940 [Halobellus sp. Atlit-31R]|nr:hypothetical protein DVK02_14940 [Halobellus sp. Atlit-31R]
MARGMKSGSVSLIDQNGTVRGTLDKESLRHAGVDTEDPGSVDWYYFTDEQLLVFDLGGDFDGDSG